MADKPFLASRKWQEQQWRALREGANPDLLEFELRFIKRMTKLGVPMFAHCVVRTAEEQQARFIEGVSKESPADGRWPHRGCAVDLVHGVMAWGLDDRQWQLCGHIGHEVARGIGVKMVWGGDDPDENDRFNWDPAHWELANWRDIMEQYPWPKPTK